MTYLIIISLVQTSVKGNVYLVLLSRLQAKTLVEILLIIHGSGLLSAVVTDT